MSIARVALDLPVDELFDYRLKPSQQVRVGQRVLVPFGRGRRVGVVMGLAEHSDIADSRLKTIEDHFDGEPLLDADVLDLCRFCAEYYQYGLGQVVLSALPPKLRETRASPIATDRQVQLSPLGQEALRTLAPRAVQARAFLEYIASNEGVTESELVARFAGARARMRAYQERGWLSLRAQTLAQVREACVGDAPPSLQLTDAQGVAVDALRQCLGTYGVFLLLGVTGSGKTEVYLRLIAEAARRDLQVLLLVPEINLTPQLEARVRERFSGVPIASLHSDLAEGERLTRWRAAQSGRAPIVLGTRLAVFAPMPKLGLIIVDEEHDESFKQDDGLRYHARDLAIFRGRQRQVPVLLASATPALETYARARAGRYQLLKLPARAAAQPPIVHCVDTRKLQVVDGLSGPLIEAVSQRLKAGEQSLVFINRRGYSPALVCYACGWIGQCPRCTARLVFHARQTQLRCHYCGHEEPVPESCISCGNQDLRPRGHGTQRLEQALMQHFPAARIARVDRDTTQRRHAFASVRDRVHAQEIDILVGTQMLAKGHDFPHLTFVAIVNADSALYSTDFRAAERLFALLMQVSGRAGRAGIQGEVMIQTDFPGHPIYQAVRRQDYEQFAQLLMDERAVTGFPPFSHQALLRAEAPERAQVSLFLAQAARFCKALTGDVEVFDPVPALMERVAGQERGQLLMQSTSRAQLSKLLQQCRRWLMQQASSKVRWHIDVDPRSI